MITFTSVGTDEEHHDGHHDRSSHQFDRFRHLVNRHRARFAWNAQLVRLHVRWTSRMLNTLDWTVHRLHAGSTRYAFVNQDFVSQTSHQDFTHHLQIDRQIFNINKETLTTNLLKLFMIWYLFIYWNNHSHLIDSTRKDVVQALRVFSKFYFYIFP